MASTFASNIKKLRFVRNNSFHITASPGGNIITHDELMSTVLGAIVTLRRFCISRDFKSRHCACARLSGRPVTERVFHTRRWTKMATMLVRNRFTSVDELFPCLNNRVFKFSCCLPRTRIGETSGKRQGDKSIISNSQSRPKQTEVGGNFVGPRDLLKDLLAMSAEGDLQIIRDPPCFGRTRD